MAVQTVKRFRLFIQDLYFILKQSFLKIKILLTNKCTLYYTYKVLKFTIKVSLYSLLHVSVYLDRPQGAYAEPC
jgi:hypothetical protein